MEYLGVVVAAVGTFALGAVWYTALSKAWLSAAGIQIGHDGKPAGAGSAMMIGFAAILIVAAMMRHVFVSSGIGTLGAGTLAGFGIGAFLITPWVVMNYAYSQRSRRLMLIDGSYSVLGCTTMGALLSFF